MKAKVIIADDEPRMAEAMARAIGKAGHATSAHTDPREVLAVIEEEGADLLITDQRMPVMSGLRLMEEAHRLQPDLPVIVVTAHGDVREAVRAMKAGAFDYVGKPFDNEDLRATAGRALSLRRLDRENRYLRQAVGERRVAHDFIAESAKSEALLDLVRRVAPSDATVLIEGETGVGKERVAKLVHLFSRRVDGPFVAVNCKAFGEGVLESELFGHEKGAFTGATTSRAGCFERASGGTLLLDEIGEVGADFQAKILRVVQEGEVLRVGGHKPRPIDVRLIAATHRDLKEEVEAGRFREDLYFRLRVIPILVPPLRERREDILPLARAFLSRHAGEALPAGREIHLSEEAEAALLAHPFHGNVRELENAIERAVVLCRGERIGIDDLLLEAQPGASQRESSALHGSLEEHLDRAAKERIEGALRTSGGKRADAARALGIDRTTLYRWMKRLEIE